MPRQPAVARALESTPVILTGFVVGTVAPLVAFFTSKGVRTWISSHGYAMFAVAVIAIAALPLALALQRRRVEPDARDVALMQRLALAIGADSELVSWLRNEFSPNYFPAGPWEGLIETHREWSDDPARRFADKHVQRKYEAALAALGEFIAVTWSETWERDEEGTQALGVPREWKGQQPERYSAAIEEISDTCQAFLLAVDDLVITAHERGIGPTA